MKTSSKVKIAIIGGSGLENLFDKTERVRVGTPYGLPPPISLGDVGGERVALLPRHNHHHTIPPHRVNYQANLFALSSLGVERVIATNAVGAIDKRLKPGNLVIPNDLVDFTVTRKRTYHDSTVTHVDMSTPYCPEIRTALIGGAKKVEEHILRESVMACTEGPRFETPAEIRMFQHFGCTVVGMTGMPEAVLARELEMCYASLCYVSNMAAGLQSRQMISELAEVAEKKESTIKQVLKESVTCLPKIRKCICAHALDEARL